MNFLEAVKALKEGKSVKRKHWVVHATGDGCIKLDSDIEFRPLIIDIEATDWEIVEKKTLSDKIKFMRMIDGTNGYGVWIEDVKESIKELKSNSDLDSANHWLIAEKDIKEIFGDRLT